MSDYSSTSVYGPPTSGQWAVGDTFTDASGTVFTCTVAGFAPPYQGCAGGYARFAATSQPFRMSVADGLTATAGGGQATAYQITTNIASFTTVATAADSAKLPVSNPGAIVIVANMAAANSMDIYGQTGDLINALAANAAFALAADKTAMFICRVAGKWVGILTA